VPDAVPQDAYYPEVGFADDTYAEDDFVASEAPVAPARTRKSKPKKRHSVKRRVIEGIAIGIAAILVIAMGFGLYYLKVVSDTVSKAGGEDCGLACVLGEAAGIGNPSTPLKTDANGRTNVLVLGTSDDRWDGEGGDWLTDSIMVVSISVTDRNAFMISIPRDLWVRYPKACSVGYEGKINAVYMCEGGDTKEVTKNRAALNATMPTFQTVTGLQIHYAVNINYSVLVDLVRAVGGKIPVTIQSDDARGIYDRVTGAKIPNGTSYVDAEMALNLARSRNSEGGYGMENSNFAREQVQQAIVRGLVQQAQANGFLTNVSGVNAALQGLGNNLRSTFTASEIVAGLGVAKAIPFSNFHSISLVSVTGTGMMGEQSIVQPTAGLYNYTGIARYIQRCISAGPMANEQATIDVLNATNRAGLATTMKSDLIKAGFTVGNTGDYTPSSSGSGTPGASQTGKPSAAPTSAPTSSVTGTPKQSGTGTISSSASVTLYQINPDMPLTAAELIKQLGVEPIAGPVPGYTSSDQADFVIILGL